MKKSSGHIALVAALMVLDQLTKILVARSVELYGSVTVIPGFFNLGLVAYYFVKTPASDGRVKLALTLILAGALGNLVDRLARGYVVDFLDFYVGRWHWPFFNVADSCITIGALLLVIFLVIRTPACSPSSSA
jgi:signal peptidase II